MSFRVEVTENGLIEIQRLDRGRWHHTPFADMDAAMIVIKFYLRRDIAKASEEKFEPMATKEARKAFAQLEEKAKLTYACNRRKTF